MTTFPAGTLFLTRKDATAFLRSCGLPIGVRALDAAATAGTGPRYIIVRNRALYTEADLLAWIAEHPSRKTARPYTHADATAERDT
jgi:hypothetical protein